MSKVEAILSQLKDIAANPKKAMDDFQVCFQDYIKAQDGHIEL